MNADAARKQFILTDRTWRRKSSNELAFKFANKTEHYRANSSAPSGRQSHTLACMAPSDLAVETFLEALPACGAQEQGAHARLADRGRFARGAGPHTGWCDDEVICQPRMRIVSLSTRRAQTVALESIRGKSRSEFVHVMHYLTKPGCFERYGKRRRRSIKLQSSD